MLQRGEESSVYATAKAWDSHVNSSQAYPLYGIVIFKIAILTYIRDIKIGFWDFYLKEM